MIYGTMFEKTGPPLKSFLNKIYHVFLLDPTKVFALIQIKLELLKNLSKQSIEMATDL